MALKLTTTTSQYVDFGNILQPISNYTFMLWFYPTELNSYKEIAGREDLSGGKGFYFEISATKKPIFHADTGSINVTGTTTLALNTWYHVVGVRDTVTANQRIYVNGVLEATAAYGTLGTVTNPFRIGMPNDWPTEGFIGSVDDVRYYNKVLTADEIATIYSCKGTDTIVDTLQARWVFNEGAEAVAMSGSGVIKDLSNNNQNGTPTGSPLWDSSFIKKKRRR
jgi:hypothetical protein